MAAISGVSLTSDAYLVCLTHALSTEKEEIMGLLMGEIDNDRRVCISAVMMLRRSDKQPDRVEISPEQLSDASTHAERLAVELQRPMRVVGWYHSHPHITVWPSHVDVQTQAMYQLLDEGFVGLIFSVFNEDKKSKTNRIQLTCFQSINQSPEGEPPQYMRLEVALHVLPEPTISPPCVEALAELPSILTQEEEEAYNRTQGAAAAGDLITAVHNGAVYSKSVCRITEVMTAPIMHMLEHRLHHNQHRITDLLERKQQLLDKLKAQKSMEKQRQIEAKKRQFQQEKAIRISPDPAAAFGQRSPTSPGKESSV